MKKSSVLVTGIICFTIALVSLVGAFVFTHVNDSNQQKKIAEFNQRQTNLRQAIDRDCELIDASPTNSFTYIASPEGCNDAKKKLDELKL